MWRSERRTAVDFAHQMRWLVDEVYPDAEVVRLVLDNLNTHQLGALYEALKPSEARRIAQRLEFHYTPRTAARVMACRGSPVAANCRQASMSSGATPG